MSGRPIGSIAVTGHGIAAWTAAAALARRLPGTTISVTPAPQARPALGDRFATMLPQARLFHAGIGLGEDRLLAATEGVFRLGARLEGWAPPAPAFVAAHGRYGPPDPPAPFHLLWLRDGGDVPFAAHAPGAVLAAAGRFAPPSTDPRHPLDHDWGIACDAGRYRGYLAAYARHLGARETPPLAGAEIGAGRIGALRLADGAALAADLYVDATGPDALLLSRLPGGAAREDWRRWLPADTVLVGEGGPDPALPPVDRVTAQANGWTLTVPLRDRTLIARTFDGAALRPEAAARDMGEAQTYRLAAGRRQDGWIGNCVAVGDAAVELEPLRAPHLHLVHSACDRIAALLPDSDFAAIETAHYNREWRAEADRFRDFLALHYQTATRPEPFWRRAREAVPPPALAETLALFRERGRLPAHDGESFGPDQWLAVLFGHGERPRRRDALADAVPPAVSLALLAAHREAVAAAADRAPAHTAVLARTA